MKQRGDGAASIIRMTAHASAMAMLMTSKA
jgi:hypothetical protein